MTCFDKNWFGSVHQNTSVCSVAQIPIQRIGLTNCSQNRHLCFAPPDLCEPMFGDVSDPSNKLTNDSKYFLFDFPSSSGDVYTLEKYNQTTKVWVEVAASLDNTQGVKYTFGDAIFNDKYDNRSGYRLDSYLVLTLYGEGKYRFVIKDPVTYENSLFSNCLCIKNWSCEKAKRTVKIYTNFTGTVSDWRLQEKKYDHDVSCMEWIDSRRYYGSFKRESPEKNTIVFIESNRKGFTNKTTNTSKFKLELNVLLREARDRLMYYGSESRAIFATDYNEDIVGASQHWTSIAMPNPYTSEEPAAINYVALATFDCEGRYKLVFDRCISCEPAPDPIIIPPPIPDSPIVSTATLVGLIDGTSFNTSSANKAEEYLEYYVEQFRLKYPDWTGDFVLEKDIKFKQGGNYEQWLGWSHDYGRAKGLKDVVMVMFIDEADPFYHGINPVVSTTPTTALTVVPPPTDSGNTNNYTDDYIQFVDDYNNYYDSFRAIVYAVPAGDPNWTPPTPVNPNGYKLNNHYINFQNHVQCAYHGEVISPSEFIPSFQDATNQLDIILTENNYSTLGSGLKHFDWFMKIDFEEPFGAIDSNGNNTGLSYNEFKNDLDKMMDP